MQANVRATVQVHESGTAVANAKDTRDWSALSSVTFCRCAWPRLWCGQSSRITVSVTFELGPGAWNIGVTLVSRLCRNTADRRMIPDADCKVQRRSGRAYHQPDIHKGKRENIFLALLSQYQTGLGSLPSRLRLAPAKGMARPYSSRKRFLQALSETGR